MKKCVIRILLRTLNSRWLNCSPCEYGFIGNVDAFSYGNLACEEKMRPGVTVKTILEEADRFRSCPMRTTGVAVLEDGQEPREANCWDLQELRNLGGPR